MYPLLDRFREIKEVDPRKFERICVKLREVDGFGSNGIPLQTATLKCVNSRREEKNGHIPATQVLKASAFYDKVHTFDGSRARFWHSLQVLWHNREDNHEYPKKVLAAPRSKPNFSWISTILLSSNPTAAFRHMLEFNQPNKIRRLLFRGQDPRVALFCLRKKFGLPLAGYLTQRTDLNLAHFEKFTRRRNALLGLTTTLEDIPEDVEKQPSNVSIDSIVIEDAPESPLPPVESREKRKDSKRLSVVEYLLDGAPEQESTNSPTDGEGKPVEGVESEDMVVYAAKEKLRKLRIIFEESDMDDEPGLDIDEFKLAMGRISNGSMSEREIELVFMKVDANCDGNVDWDEFLEYTLREYQERDLMNQLSQDIYFGDIPCIRASVSKEIKALIFAPQTAAISLDAIDWSVGRYYSASAEGLIKCWSMDFVQSGEDFALIPAYKSAACFERVCDMVCLPEIRAIVVAFSNGFLKFYYYEDVKWTMFCVVYGLPHSPCCFNYVFFDGKSMLMFADQSGLIQCIRFKNMFYDGFWTALGVSQPPNGVLAWALLERQNKCLAIRVTSPRGDWISQIRFVPEINCIFACSNDPVDSLIMASVQQDRPLLRASNARGGFNCFDYHARMHLIATGGRDRILNIFQPDRLDKPLISYSQHRTSIEMVMLTQNRRFTAAITIDAFRSIRVFDLKEHVLHQEFDFPVIGILRSTVTFLIWNTSSEEFIYGGREILSITRHVNKPMTVDESFIPTHKKPVVGALYNDLFDCVVSACEDSTVMVWNFQTGEKIIQYTNAHSHRVAGKVMPIPIKNITFDADKRRLVTVGEDGIIKLWNFNNGACLTAYTQLEGHDVNVVRYHCNRDLVIAAGFDQNIFMVRDTRGEDDVDETQYRWPILHRSDVVTVEIAYLPHHTIPDAGDTHGSIVFASSITDTSISMSGTTVESSLDASTSVADAQGRLEEMEEEETAEECSEEKEGDEEDECLKDDGSSLISGSFDGEIIVWSVFTGEAQCFLNTDGSIHALDAFTRNALASKRTVDTPRVLQVDSGELELFTDLQQRCNVKRQDQAELTLSEREEIRERPRETLTSAPRLIQPTPGAITSLLTLKARSRHANVACLLSASTDGFIRAWSISPGGGLQSLFYAGHRINDFVTAMSTDEKNELLFTTDSSGYVKVWFICDWAAQRHTCPQHTFDIRPFPAIRHHRYFAPLMALREARIYRQATASLAPEQRLIYHAPLMLNSFRAHLTSIRSIDICCARQVIITASKDTSVRLWTFAGLYVGTLGQPLHVDISNNIAEKPVKHAPSGVTSSALEQHIKEAPSDEVLLQKPRAAVPQDIAAKGSAMTLDVIKNRQTQADSAAENTPGASVMEPCPFEDSTPLDDFRFDVRNQHDPTVKVAPFVYFGYHSPVTTVYGELNIYANLPAKHMRSFDSLAQLLPPCIYDYSVKKILDAWLIRLPSWLKPKYERLQENGVLYGAKLREMMHVVLVEEQKQRDARIDDAYTNKLYQDYLKRKGVQDMSLQIDSKRISEALHRMSVPATPSLVDALLRPSHKQLLALIVDSDNRHREKLVDKVDRMAEQASHTFESEDFRHSHLETALPIKTPDMTLLALVRRLDKTLRLETRLDKQSTNVASCSKSEFERLYGVSQLSERVSRDYATLHALIENTTPRKLPPVPAFKRKHTPPRPIEPVEQELLQPSETVNSKRSVVEVKSQFSDDNYLTDLDTVAQEKKILKKIVNFVEIGEDFAPLFAVDETAYQAELDPKILSTSSYGTFRSHFVVCPNKNTTKFGRQRASRCMFSRR